MRFILWFSLFYLVNVSYAFKKDCTLQLFYKCQLNQFNLVDSVQIYLYWYFVYRRTLFYCASIYYASQVLPFFNQLKVWPFTCKKIMTYFIMILTWLQYLLCYSGLQLNLQYFWDMPVLALLRMSGTGPAILLRYACSCPITSERGVLKLQQWLWVCLFSLLVC